MLVRLLELDKLKNKPSNLCSVRGERFAHKERVVILGERSRETLRDPPPDALEAEFEDQDWAVHIYW